MSTLRGDVADYLATRRAMGFKVEGLSKLLTNFVTFCEARGAVRVQNEVALEWAATPMKAPVTDALFARRMDAVRVFARFQHALDPDTQVPPEGICRRRYQPREPNVFDQAQIGGAAERCRDPVPAVQGGDVADPDRHHQTETSPSTSPGLCRAGTSSSRP